MDFGGEIIADSEMIFEFLDWSTRGQRYKDLSAEQRAVGTDLSKIICIG